jgi:hypothetical protein
MDRRLKLVQCPCEILQRKAKSLFDDLKAKEGECSENEEFNASQGWFQRFKRRYSFHHIKVTGEQPVLIS